MKATLSESNNWSYSFTGLEKYENGEQIVYTVVEVTKVAGYEVSYQLDSYTGIYEVINTHAVEKTEITVNKVWVDRNDQDGLRPDSIEVELYANGVATGKKLTITAAEHWEGTFEDLDKYADGEQIIYTVKETAVAGYSSSVTVDSYTGVVTVTNTHEVEKTEITVNKVWVDNNDQDGIRPESIEVELYANGVATGKKLTLSAFNNWQAAWTELPVYSHGVAIVYTVKETEVAGYVTEYAYEGNSVTITNTHTPETVTVSATKQWDDGDNRDGIHPDHVILVLMANGVATDLQRKLNTDNGWFAEWTDLPKYENGALIYYTVEEVNVAEGYESIVESASENAYEWIVVNRHEPAKTSMTVLKLWADQNNELGIRPESIIIALLANGEVVEEVVLDERNGWTYTWVDLYQYADGQQIVYTVQEMTNDENYIVSYDQAIGESGEDVWVITNTIIDKTPDTGDAIRYAMMAMVTSLAALLVVMPTSKKKEQEA